MTRQLKETITVPENPTPEVVALPDLDDYPMTLTEWSKLHRLLAIGKAQLSVANDHIPALDFMGDAIVLRFFPAVKAQRYMGTHGGRQGGTITHACLTRDGLRVAFADEGRVPELMLITDVVSVEQVL